MTEFSPSLVGNTTLETEVSNGIAVAPPEVTPDWLRNVDGIVGIKSILKEQGII